MLATLASLVGLLAPFGTAQSPELSDAELKGCALVMTEGIRGGVGPPRPMRQVVMAFDWNTDSFRVAEWEGFTYRDPQTRVAGVSASDFREILNHVAGLGIACLPLEDPIASEDIYGRNVGIQFQHGSTYWSNGAPSGCTSWPSFSQPNGEERERFDAILAYMEETLDSLPMQPGTVLDLQLVPVTCTFESRAYRTAIQHLKREPFAAEVDFNRIRRVWSGREGDVIEFKFAWREAQHRPGSVSNWPGYFEVEVNGDLARTVSIVRPEGNLPEDRERRRAYVDAHPALSSGFRRLILTGWVGRGMTEAMALASWGPAGRRDVQEWGGVTLRFDRGPRSLSFEDGRIRFELGIPGHRSRPRPPGWTAIDGLNEMAEQRRRYEAAVQKR